MSQVRRQGVVARWFRGARCDKQRGGAMDLRVEVSATSGRLRVEGPARGCRTFYASVTVCRLHAFLSRWDTARALPATPGRLYLVGEVMTWYVGANVRPRYAGCVNRSTWGEAAEGRRRQVIASAALGVYGVAVVGVLWVGKVWGLW